MSSTITSNLLLLDHSESICFINELCQRSAISQENGTALFLKARYSDFDKRSSRILNKTDGNLIISWNFLLITLFRNGIPCFKFFLPERVYLLGLWCNLGAFFGIFFGLLSTIFWMQLRSA